MSKGEEYPGNTMMSQAAFDRRLYNHGKHLLELQDGFNKCYLDGNRLRALRLVAPEQEAGEWLAVLTIVQDGEPLVAFSSGFDLVSCLQTLNGRMRNGSLKWKVDEYAK